MVLHGQFFNKMCFLCKNDANLESNSKRSQFNQEGQKFQQILCSVLVSIGALQVGSSIAWPSPALKYLLNENYTDPSFLIDLDEANWVAALTPFGSIFGTIPGGMLADIFGRKLTLFAFCIPGIAGWLIKTHSTGVVSLYAARFTIGVMIGIFTSIIPTYTIEIAEVSIRGRLGSFFEIFVNMGIVLMYLFGCFESYYTLNDCNAFLCGIYLFCLLLIPESPVYLVKKNELKLAEKSLRRLRGPEYNVQKELEELCSFLHNETKQKFSFSVLRQKANVRSLILAFSLVAMQQLSGVSVVVSFAESIFVHGNVPSPILFATLLGVTQLVFTLVSTVVVDHVGRKALLILSCSGISVALAALGCYFYALENFDSVSLAWLPILCLVFFMMMFALGLGPVTWLMLGEILGPDIKKFAFGLAGGSLLTTGSIVIYSFHPLISAITIAGTFWMFCCIGVLSTIYTIFFVPETKNKTLMQIQNELGGKVVKKPENVESF